MSIERPGNRSRRRFLALAAGAAALASALSSRGARAADLPHLAESDPAAKALGYRADARTVVAGNYRPGQECGKCNFFKGAAGAEWGPCQLFPGKDVHVKGWCTAFTPKP